jgi:hypothetical protein
MKSVTEALDALRGVGTVKELETLAARGSAPRERPRVNSHIHLPPNFSAFEQVSQAVDLAAQQDVRVVGVSNYYDFTVYGEFAAQARRKGIFPLYGLEIIALVDTLLREGVKINDPGNPGKLYICGKGITRFAPFSSEAERLMNVIRRNDAQRMAEMTRKMEGRFAAGGLPTGLDANAVIERVVRRHECARETVCLQERHVAQAFQEVAFEKTPTNHRLDKLAAVLGARPKNDDSVKVQNDIRSCLMKSGKPAFVEERFVSFEEARTLILELGGVPCYPVVADGATPVSAFEQPVEKLIENIRRWNIHGAEFVTIRNKPDVLAQYVKTMRAAGLFVTAGTEHNTLDLLPIEPRCAGGGAVPEEVKAILWEGACVVAAHQFLTLHGQCGFVDKHGEPNPAYRNAEERIAAFSKLGAAVIQRYFEGSAEC